MTLTQKVKLQKTLTTAHEQYARSLSLHASFKVNNRDLAEDLVQQTFMKTWSYLVKGGEIEKMKAFLYHVLNNLIVDEYRRKKMESLNVLMEKGFEPCATDTANLEDRYDGRKAILLIQRLPVTYRKVMHLRYVGEFSLTEISCMTGLPKNTIAVQIHRGVQKIRIYINSNQPGSFQ